MSIEIANRLTKFRKEKGLSQEALAEALGISRQAVSKWECGESSPDTDNLIALSKLYGISIYELLGTNANEEENEKNLNNNIINEHKTLDKLSNIMPLLCTATYLLLGFWLGIWHPGWVIFLFIPLWTSLISAIKNKNLQFFSYPIFVVMIYILLSSIFHIWHPLWIIFLTIPIFYMISSKIKRKD